MLEIYPKTPINYKEKEDYKDTCEALQCIDEATDILELNVEKCGISDILLCKECKPHFENLNEHQISQLKTKQNGRD